jgi:Skp family chaperone for outer membrane proteins
LAWCVLLVGLATVAQAQPGATEQFAAVIDVDRVLSESAAGKQELARVQSMQEGLLGELQAMQNEIQQLQNKLKSVGFSIAETERRKMQREIEDKVIEGKRREKDFERQINAELESVMAELEKKVIPIIEQIGSERGIQLIFNRALPGLVYADPDLDITGEVIKRLDASTQAGG